MKQRISAGVILLALLTFCVPVYHQTVRASDMEAQTEVRLHIDENDKAAVSDSNDAETDGKADRARVQTGDSANILAWSLTAGTGLLVCVSAVLIRKKQLML